MSDEIQPALPGGEWERLDAKEYAFLPNGRQIDTREGTRMDAEPGDVQIWGPIYDGDSIVLRQAERHGAAAVLLHGQPFGFAQEDVHVLNQALSYLSDVTRDDWDDLRSLRSRIAALLPPEERA